MEFSIKLSLFFSYCQALLGLCKLNVISLIVVTATVGMLLSYDKIPNLAEVFLCSFSILLVSAAAAVFNHIFDQKNDAKMNRTSQRPLIQQKVSNNNAIIFALVLASAGLLISWFGFNPLAAILNLITLLGYSFVYTLVLKRLSVQNIVLGGISGAMPPILGSVAILGYASLESIMLFFIIFVWTPPHFWALAIAKREEYKNIDIPTLSVTHGNEFTGRIIFLYSLLLLIVSILPVILGSSSFLYLFIISILNMRYLQLNYLLLKQPEDKKLAMQSFLFSIKYLFILFMAFVVDYYLFFLNLFIS